MKSAGERVNSGGEHDDMTIGRTGDGKGYASLLLCINLVQVEKKKELHNLHPGGGWRWEDDVPGPRPG